MHGRAGRIDLVESAQRTTQKVGCEGLAAGKAYSTARTPDGSAASGTAVQSRLPFTKMYESVTQSTLNLDRFANIPLELVF